jgi:hypothetical protein
MPAGALEGDVPFSRARSTPSGSVDKETLAAAAECRAV